MELVEAFDAKVDKYSQPNEYLNILSNRSQGLSLTFTNVSHILTDFCIGFFHMMTWFDL